MTLGAGLNAAKSSLLTTSGYVALISRNIARAQDASASRKFVGLTTIEGGGVRLGSITRVSDTALFETNLAATSASAGQTAIARALDELSQTVNDPELDASVPALIGKLTEALQLYSAGPQDAVRGDAAVGAAHEVAKGLNAAAQTVESIRQQADDEMKAGVDRLNTLLAKFGEVNSSIVKGTSRGEDVTDQLDNRDSILTDIAELVGVRTIVRANNDVALFTDSGVTLFETKARDITFAPASNLSAGVSGSAIIADGMAITGNAPMAVQSGRLSGLAFVRDSVTVQYQRQLDEVARGLIETFAESNQGSEPALPDAAGLFTYSGAPAVPASGIIVNGLAGDIRVNPNVDPESGGDPWSAPENDTRI